MSQARSPGRFGQLASVGTGVANHPGAVIRRSMCCVGGVRVRPATMCDLLALACDGELRAAPAVTCVTVDLLRSARIRTRAHAYARARTRTTQEHSRTTRRARPHFAHPLQPGPTARELLTELRPPTPHPLPSQSACAQSCQEVEMSAWHHASRFASLYCMHQPLLHASATDSLFATHANHATHAATQPARRKLLQAAIRPPVRSVAMRCAVAA